MKKIFICYSHKDEKWKDELLTQLKVLQMQDLLEVWDDRRIEAGEDWYNKIKKAINEADAAILLISAEFLTSDFILNDEIPKLLQRRAKEEMKIFPLIVEACAKLNKEYEEYLKAGDAPKDGTVTPSTHGR